MRDPLEIPKSWENMACLLLLDNSRCLSCDVKNEITYLRFLLYNFSHIRILCDKKNSPGPLYECLLRSKKIWGDGSLLQEE